MKIIKFQIVSEKSYGTEEKPDLRQVFNDKQCKYTETAYADALKEAYNGEVTVEDIPDTRPLHEIKSERQAENKAALAAWLASHPLTWLDGKRYGVEEQDQNRIGIESYAVPGEQGRRTACRAGMARPKGGVSGV